MGRWIENKNHKELHFGPLVTPTEEVELFEKYHSQKRSDMDHITIQQFVPNYYIPFQKRSL